MTRAIRSGMKKRNNRGAVSTLLTSFFLVATIAASSLALDISHAVMVHTELQTAVDSAALAGAYASSQGSSQSARVASAVSAATTCASLNRADNVSVANGSGMSVQVAVTNSGTGYSVAVTATRTIAPLFARVLGMSSFPVSARGIATGSAGMSMISSQQVTNLAISLNTVPDSGPQTQSPLNSYYGPLGARPFTIVLNPQGSKNSAWVKDWSGAKSPVLQPGVSQISLQNGVMESQLANLSVGQTVVAPLVLGDPPFNDQRTVVGVVGFTITAINKPNTISGYITTPVCKGIPGSPAIPCASAYDLQFLQSWSPISVHLTQ